MLKFKIRCSDIYDICAGSDGLTEKQNEAYLTLSKRKSENTKPLTSNMENELSGYIYRLSNPELPTGAKTYCEEWLKEYRFKRYEEINTKQVIKGNETEESGFTLLAIQLKLGMVFKNTQWRENDYLHGTDDLFTNGIVYDNKSCWNLKTFPMYKKENPKPEYEWQLNGYGDLRGCNDLVLAYTLNDTPNDLIWKEIRFIDDHRDRAKKVNNMVFTLPSWGIARTMFFDTISDFEFIPIPDNERIKKFEFKKDQSKLSLVRKRVIMCNDYINNVLLAQ